MALTRRALAGVLAAVLLGVGTLSVVGAGASWAGPKDEDKGQRGQGQGGQSGRSGWTEDNDTNDGGTPNNVPDEGDNRHPSGKDRSVENGGGTQGRSTSDPDGMSNGGPDKPNGSGGVDKADQDGNNGCGNDDDFEDDNNGNCGGRKKQRRGWNSVSATSTESDSESSRSASSDGRRFHWSRSFSASSSTSSESRSSESRTIAVHAEVATSSGAVWVAGRTAGLGTALQSVVRVTGSTTAAARVARAAGAAGGASAAAGGGGISAAEAPALAFSDDDTRVMGTRFERDEPAFAFTGGDFARLVLAGLLALALGTALAQARRARPVA